MGASLLWNRPRGSRPPFRNNGRIDAPDLARSRLVLPGRHRSFLRAFSARGRIEHCRNNGRIVGSAEDAMGDATPGRACTAAAAPATGRAAPAGGPAGGRRRAAGAGVGEFGVAVVADVSARRAAGPAAQADPGPTAAVVRGAAAPAVRILARGPRRAGLRGRRYGGDNRSISEIPDKDPRVEVGVDGDDATTSRASQHPWLAP